MVTVKINNIHKVTVMLKDMTQAKSKCNKRIRHKVRFIHNKIKILSSQTAVEDVVAYAVLRTQVLGGLVFCRFLVQLRLLFM